MARGMGLTMEATDKFYDILKNEIKSHNLKNKPQNIFNVDESGVQLINDVGHVITKKGAKVVHKLTTGEKGETVLLLAALLRSALINSDLFYKWIKDIIPRTAPGRNILILDGHCSHVSSIALLEFEDQNGASYCVSHLTRLTLCSAWTDHLWSVQGLF
ncbi:hypothetical protein J6590_076777 [Homalodisca vitripennis]|nr:hypothetical protein J6590_076777 [Homalodisca vitripennis]